MGSGLRVLGFRVCHGAAARPTHAVVVSRAAFVTWNPRPPETGLEGICVLLLPLRHAALAEATGHQSDASQ